MEKLIDIDITLTFRETDLIKVPSVHCSFKKWIEWLSENYDKVVDWDSNYFEFDD